MMNMFLRNLESNEEIDKKYAKIYMVIEVCLRYIKTVVGTNFR